MAGRLTMIWESLAWVAVAIAAFGLVTSSESWLRARCPNTWPHVRRLAPWVIGLGPAYLALLRGAVLARTYGLYGRGGPVGWAASTLFCAALLAALWKLRRRVARQAAEYDVILSSLDEPRWALYRAAGVQLIGTWGLLIGLAIGAAEWALGTTPWRDDGSLRKAAWFSLVRLSLSTALFALTGNVWLTWLTQAVGWSILRTESVRQGEST